MSALNMLKRHFSQVDKIVDAKEGIRIEVTAEDNRKGRRKDPNSCALVKACLREHIADAAVIGVSFSYLIKDNKATRYKTSVGIAREITSFDRHQDFQSGKNYLLSPVSKSNRLGRKRPKRNEPTGKKYKKIIHRTENIRKMER